MNDTDTTADNIIITTESTKMRPNDTSTTPLNTPTKASETMNNQVQQTETIGNVTEQSVTEDKKIEQVVQTLAEGSTGFFNVVKPKEVKKVADCNPEELREYIRVKLFPRKDGLTTVYTTLAGITPLLIEGKKSFQVRSITKDQARDAVLAIPKHILDNMLLIAQSEYVSTKRHSTSEEAKKERLENKALKALAKRNKKREEVDNLEVSNALFEAKKNELANTKASEKTA